MRLQHAWQRIRVPRGKRRAEHALASRRVLAAAIVLLLLSAAAISALTPAAGAAPAAAPAAPGACAGNATPAPSPQSAHQDIVVSDAVHLRAGPGTECPILTTLQYGTVVTVDGAPVTRDGYTWRHLRTPQRTGYSIADALQPLPAAGDKPSTVPILMYHHIGTPASRYYVSPDELDAQLSWLRDQGYVSITATDLAHALFDGAPLPSKPVMITMDDGNASTLTLAAHLAEYGFRGVYPLPNYAELTPDQIRNLAANGEVCGHTVTHPDLSQVSDADQRWEITQNKAWLEQIIGKPVTCFAYPFGTYGPDTAGIVADAGFTLAFNAWGGPVHLANADRWHLPRMEVDGGYDFSVFIAEMHRES